MNGAPYFILNEWQKSFLLSFQNENAETVDDSVVRVAEVLEVDGDVVVGEGYPDVGDEDVPHPPALQLLVVGGV